MERDPIGFAGGLNTYVYVEGGPIDAVDRSGLLSDFDLTYGVQGASRGELRAGFEAAAPGVAVVGAVGGAAAAGATAPAAFAAVGGAVARAAQTAYLGAQTAAFELALAEAGAAVSVGAGCAKEASTEADALLAAAAQSYKNGPLSVAGRALTKHPNIIRESGNLLQKLRGASGVNAAAQEAVEKMIADGIRGAAFHPQHGNVIEFKFPSGLVSGSRQTRVPSSGSSGGGCEHVPRRH